MQNLHLPSGPLKLACLAAHPDDIEIAAGATLLALAERGSVDGYWLTLTGSPGRHAEAEAAAQAFLPGAKSTFHTFQDGRLPAHWNDVKDILHAFRLIYQTSMWCLRRGWTTPIKTIGCWARWRRPCGVMLSSFITRFRSGTATSGNSIATCPSRPNWASGKFRY